MMNQFSNNPCDDFLYSPLRYPSQKPAVNGEMCYTYYMLCYEVEEFFFERIRKIIFTMHVEYIYYIIPRHTKQARTIVLIKFMK